MKQVTSSLLSGRGEHEDRFLVIERVWIDSLSYRKNVDFSS